jgi:hypothetical protein
MSERGYLLAAIERCEKRAKIASSDALSGPQVAGDGD